MSSVNKIRLRRSGISVMLLIDSSMLIDSAASNPLPGPFHSQAQTFWAPCLDGLDRNDRRLAARLPNLIKRGLREEMRRNMERRFQFALAQNLEPVVQPFDQTALEKKLRRHRFLCLEPREVSQVNHRVALLEDIGKTSLGKTPLQGHLAALEAGSDSRACS